MPRVVDTTFDISPREILCMDLDEYVDMCAHDDWSVGYLLASVLLRNPVFLPLSQLPAALQKELIMDSQATWVRTLSFLALLQLTMNVSSASDLAECITNDWSMGSWSLMGFGCLVLQTLSIACMMLTESSFNVFTHIT